MIQSLRAMSVLNAAAFTKIPRCARFEIKQAAEKRQTQTRRVETWRGAATSTAGNFRDINTLLPLHDVATQWRTSPIDPNRHRKKFDKTRLNSRQNSREDTHSQRSPATRERRLQWPTAAAFCIQMLERFPNFKMLLLGGSDFRQDEEDVGDQSDRQAGKRKTLHSADKGDPTRKRWPRKYARVIGYA